MSDEKMPGKRSICALSPNGRRAHEVDVESVIRALAQHGLHVVTEAEKRVLDALSRARIGAFCDDAPRPHLDLEDDREIAELELARRRTP